MAGALNAVQIVVTLLILMSIGYFLTAKKWIDDKVAHFLSQLVLWIGVPASTFDNMFNHFSAEMLAGAGIALLAPLASVILSFLIAIPVARLFKVEKHRRGIFYNMFAFSNTIFIGLPVSQALFGESATPYALFYYMGNTITVWTLGIYALQRDGNVRAGNVEKQKIFSMATLKKILSPGLVSFVLALGLVMLDFKMPLFAEKTFRYLGSICTPLALIFIGHVIYNIGLKNLRFQKDTWGVLIGRLIVSPVLVYLLVILIGAPLDMSKVFIVQAAMPVMSNAPILAKAYGSDSEFASETMALTTLLSMITMPLLMMLFQVIF
ncbi:MAG: AEC family transporter [Christensenellaceae bacterium]|jgi:auxin efflux carrier (AEC)